MRPGCWRRHPRPGGALDRGADAFERTAEDNRPVVVVKERVIALKNDQRGECARVLSERRAGGEERDGERREAQP